MLTATRPPAPTATRLRPPEARPAPEAVRAAWALGRVAAGPVLCPSCRAPIARTYCTVCGEKRRDARCYRLRSVLARSAQAALDLDGRALRTLRTLVAQPGALTTHVIDGRWAPYLRPLQVFLLANVVFFLWAATPFGVNTFTTPLRLHVEADFAHSAVAGRWVEARVAERATTFEAYAEVFDRRVGTLSRSLIILMIPGLALVFGLLHPRRLVARHAAAACHFMAFALLALVGIISALSAAITLGYAVGLTPFSVSDVVLSATFALLFAAYAVGMMRRAYGDGWGRALVGGAATVVLLVPLVQAYRALLFFAAFATT
jgi:hypothetical protein